MDDWPTDPIFPDGSPNPMSDGDPIEDADTAEECAILLGECYGMRPTWLLHSTTALVEATARWHIRGDHNVEALSWLSELVSYHGASSDKIARLAAIRLERDLLACVKRFVTSNRIPTLPA